ncbi:hypothetical protein OG455_21605 [Kitasatospora sp. NBC_01287]|uniref:hypothetical protein n=1 Tax=Kitasatospora sp. NBC_01287 TaxID=2903573 RepID=UPI0022560648|nr:hypothetical protein [Kitasatospora sp. NBC_01287]MCX4748078.1 hypothetical protein [Kitasatospora sp. NBC_01287]
MFDLPNPASFAKLPGISAAELGILRRYVHTCQELSESTILSHSSGVSINMSDGVEAVIADFPAKEAIRGTTVLFRQMASAQEPASYSQVRKIIGQIAHQHHDEHRDQRLELQRLWNRAHGQLNSRLLTAMADRKALELMGAHPNLPVPGEDVKPQEVLSLFQYGDLIHWDRHAEAFQEVANDDFQHKWQTLKFLSVMTQLSRFYLGYSLLVARAVGDH